MAPRLFAFGLEIPIACLVLFHAKAMEAKSSACLFQSGHYHRASTKTYGGNSNFARQLASVRVGCGLGM